MTLENLTTKMPLTEEFARRRYPRSADRCGASRIQAPIDRRTYPAQARDLNFLAGALCGLMANASPEAAHCARRLASPGERHQTRQ